MFCFPDFPWPLTCEADLSEEARLEHRAKQWEEAIQRGLNPNARWKENRWEGVELLSIGVTIVGVIVTAFIVLRHAM